MKFRSWEAVSDRKHIVKLQKEITPGFLSDSREENCFYRLLKKGRVMVAEINGTVEGYIASSPSHFRIFGNVIKASTILFVGTAFTARKRNVGLKLSASLLAEEARHGNIISLVKAHDQGYFNRLGFGNGPEERICSFTPSSLNVYHSNRYPVRLHSADISDIHKSRQNRLKTHGALTLDTPSSSELSLRTRKNSYGLGFFQDKTGDLTHHLVLEPGTAKNTLNILWTAYKNLNELRELLALIKGMGDQIMQISMRIPAGIILQDLIDHPVRQSMVTPHSGYFYQGISRWQYRILNLEEFVKKLSFPGSEIRLNLEVNDPVHDFLSGTAEWKGIGGQYSLILGEKCELKHGFDGPWPTLHASAGALTRLLTGLSSATGLSATDSLKAPQALLQELDGLRLPLPETDWDLPIF